MRLSFHFFSPWTLFAVLAAFSLLPPQMVQQLWPGILRVLCPALPASAAPTFRIQGTQRCIADPLSLSLFLQPLPHLHLLKLGRETNKQTVKIGNAD